MRLITTCEHVSGVFLNLEVGDEFGIDFAQLDHTVQRMRQVLQQSLVPGTLWTSAVYIASGLLEIWMNQ